MSRSARLLAVVLVAAAGCGAPVTGPIALDDVVTADPSEPLVVEVLRNDRAPEGGRLRLVATGSGTGRTEIVDDHIVYRPPPDLTTDRFSYTVRDDAGRIATAMVTVLTDPAPTTTPPPTTTEPPAISTTTTEPAPPTTTTATTTTTEPPPTTTTTTTTEPPPTTTTTTTEPPPTTTTTTTTTEAPTTTTTTTTTTEPPPTPARFDHTVVRFGRITVGEAADHWVTVTAGSRPHVVGIADPLVNAGVGFNVDRRCGTLGPGESCRVVLTFAPTVADPAFDITLFPGQEPSLRVTATVTDPVVPPPEWRRPSDGATLEFGRSLDGIAVVLVPDASHREVFVEAEICAGGDGCVGAGFDAVRRSPLEVERVVFHRDTLIWMREALAEGVDVGVRLAATATSAVGRSDPAIIELTIVDSVRIRVDATAPAPRVLAPD